MPRRSNQEALLNSDDVHHGFGTVKAIHTKDGLRWMLPGNVLTSCREEATRFAQKMDRLIQANVKRYDRSLI